MKNNLSRGPYGSSLLVSALLLAAVPTALGGLVMSPVDPDRLPEVANGAIEETTVRRSLSRHVFAPTVQVAVVPEPSTYVAGALLALPVAAGMWRRLRKR